MQQAHLNLIKFTIAANHTVSVFDGEVWEVKKSTSYKAIKDCIDSVEESQLRIMDASGNSIGWAHIIVGGMEPDETVVDYTVTDFMEEWDAQYTRLTA